MPDPAAPADGRLHRGGRPRDPSRDLAIRAAILRVLARSGYAALTMDAVAAEAGVGKATIYRRWRTKGDLVAAAVASIGETVTVLPDGGSLEADLRALLRCLVVEVNGPAGTTTRALLSAMPHEPRLREAIAAGPIGRWLAAFGEVWSRAERRGEVRPGITGTTVAATASALVLQRWLFGAGPVDEAFADQVLADVVLPWSPPRPSATRAVPGIVSRRHPCP